MFEQRDGMDNGLPDASFDRVWALESSHLMRARDRFVSESARVLRPGGRLVLCDIVLRQELPFLEVRRLRKELGLLRDVFGDARMEPLALYGSMARAEGLVVEQETDLTAPTRPTFARWRENASTHRGAVVEALGEADVAAFVASCARAREAVGRRRAGLRPARGQQALGAQTAVDDQHLPGDEPGLLGRQEQHGVGDIGRFAEPAHRGAALDLPHVVLVQAVRHLGAQVARRDRVDGDAA